MENKTNELEGKTNGASYDSFTEQASEMFNKSFITVKEETRRLLHFKVLIPRFLVENVRRSNYKLPLIQEENLKPGADKGRKMWEPKVYLIAQPA